MDQVSSDLVGWLTVIAGLAMIAFGLHLKERWQGAAAAIAPVEMCPFHMPMEPMEPARQLALVTAPALRELARASELPPLRMGAEACIDAAEHAFNRIIAELATIDCHVIPPTFLPAQQLVRQPYAAPHRQPLAA